MNYQPTLPWTEPLEDALESSTRESSAQEASALLTPPPARSAARGCPWHIDDRTRQVGLAGVHAARAVLAEAACQPDHERTRGPRRAA